VMRRRGFYGILNLRDPEEYRSGPTARALHDALV
jgi:hypothetical protein